MPRQKAEDASRPLGFRVSEEYFLLWTQEVQVVLEAKVIARTTAGHSTRALYCLVFRIGALVGEKAA